MKNQIKVTVNYYRLDTSKVDQCKEYNELKTRLKKEGYKLFDSISMTSYDAKVKFFNDIRNKTFEVDTNYIFDNQFNTVKTESHSGYRLFDWKEEIYPNKSIKEGYFCTGIEALNELRQKTYHCNYCGKQYNENIGYCKSCLNSQYLEENQIHLLEVTEIGKKYKNTKTSKALLKEYNKVQKIARLKKLEESKAQKLDSIKKDIAASKTKYKIFKEIIKLNVSIDNVIYYKHNDSICFGWRTPLQITEIEIIKKSIKDSTILKQYKITFE